MMKEMCPSDNQPHNFIPVDNGYFRNAGVLSKNSRYVKRVKVVTMACTKCLRRGTIETNNTHTNIRG